MHLFFIYLSYRLFAYNMPNKCSINIDPNDVQFQLHNPILDQESKSGHVRVDRK